MPGHYKHHLRFILHVGPMYLNLNLINIIFNPFSAGTVFRRQNLTSKDVRFWRLKTLPALKKVKIDIMAADPKHKYLNEVERTY